MGVFFSNRKLVFLVNLAYYNGPRAYCEEDHVDGPVRMNHTKTNSTEYGRDTSTVMSSSTARVVWLTVQMLSKHYKVL